MAKLLYIVAEGFQPRSISQLARCAGVDRSSASEACAELARAGWMRLVKSGQQRVPIAVVPHALQRMWIQNLMKALELTSQKGEFLMKCWLDLLITSDEYVDNARPGFLLNPLSGQPLEFDRYYLAGVAFEFNGSQHYGPTVMYPDEQAFKELRARDLLKKGLSQEKGIVLVSVSARDLALERMCSRIPESLPRCYVDRDSAYVKALERVSAEYVKKAGDQGH